MKKSLVSVIIPTYNRKDFLEESIKSVVNQTYSNIEIVVVDDGSPANYAEAICKQYANCKYYWKENGGISTVRNFGIERVKGDFIAFLDDDDLWKPHKIEKQLDIFEKYKDVDLVHSSAQVIDKEGNVTGRIIGASKNKAHKRSGYVFWSALGIWLVKSPTPLIRKRVFESNLRFDETLSAGEDFDFYNRLFYKHKVYYISEPLAFYRVYESDSRLSLNKEAYKGVELKMFNNLMQMGIKNPIVRYRIAYVLLNATLSKLKRNNSNFHFNLSILEKLIYPKKSLIKLTTYAQGL